MTETAKELGDSRTQPHHQKINHVTCGSVERRSVLHFSFGHGSFRYHFHTLVMLMTSRNETSDSPDRMKESNIRRANNLTRGKHL